MHGTGAGVQGATQCQPISASRSAGGRGRPDGAASSRRSGGKLFRGKSPCFMLESVMWSMVMGPTQMRALGFRISLPKMLTTGKQLCAFEECITTVSDVSKLYMLEIKR